MTQQEAQIWADSLTISTQSAKPVPYTFWTKNAVQSSHWPKRQVHWAVSITKPDGRTEYLYTTAQCLAEVQRQVPAPESSTP